jgi:RNA polymerase sigma factor (sigma-70 family)
MTDQPLDSVLRHINQFLGARSADELTDGELLRRFVGERREDAFAGLLHRHGPLVLSVWRRVLTRPHDVEDAFQATFLVLVRKAASLDQWGSLGNWLHTVAYHIALKVRSQSQRARGTVEHVEDLPAPDMPTACPDLRPVLDEELCRLPKSTVRR